MGNSAIFFKADASRSAAPVTSLSFNLPSGATPPGKVIVTGLVSGAPCTLINQGGSYQVTQGGVNLADASGTVLF